MDLLDALHKCPLEANLEPSLGEKICEFKKVLVKPDGNKMYEYLSIRYEDLSLLATTLRAAFGGDCLDAKIKFREFL